MPARQIELLLSPRGPKPLSSYTSTLDQEPEKERTKPMLVRAITEAHMGGDKLKANRTLSPPPRDKTPPTKKPSAQAKGKDASEQDIPAHTPSHKRSDSFDINKNSKIDRERKDSLTSKNDAEPGKRNSMTILTKPVIPTIDIENNVKVQAVSKYTPLISPTKPTAKIKKAETKKR